MGVTGRFLGDTKYLSRCQSKFSARCPAPDSSAFCNVRKRHGAPRTLPQAGLDRASYRRSADFVKNFSKRACWGVDRRVGAGINGSPMRVALPRRSPIGCERSGSSPRPEGECASRLDADRAGGMRESSVSSSPSRARSWRWASSGPRGSRPSGWSSPCRRCWVASAWIAGWTIGPLADDRRGGAGVRGRDDARPPDRPRAVRARARRADPDAGGHVRRRDD